MGEFGEVRRAAPRRLEIQRCHHRTPRYSSVMCECVHITRKGNSCRRTEVRDRVTVAVHYSVTERRGRAGPWGRGRTPRRPQRCPRPVQRRRGHGEAPTCQVVYHLTYDRSFAPGSDASPTSARSTSRMSMPCCGASQSCRQYLSAVASSADRSYCIVSSGASGRGR